MLEYCANEGEKMEIYSIDYIDIIINSVIMQLSGDINDNCEYINNQLDIDYKDVYNRTLLSIVASNKFNELNAMLAIKSLLKLGLDPNSRDCFGMNFIDLAIISKYSENFILEIINEALKYGLKVNHIDDDNNTMVHIAIYSKFSNYLQIIKLLHANGFNCNIKNKMNQSIEDALVASSYDLKDINQYTDWFNKHVKKENIKSEIDSFVINHLNLYGTILSDFEYNSDLLKRRENELKSLMNLLNIPSKSIILINGDEEENKEIIKKCVDKINRELKSKTKICKIDIQKLTMSSVDYDEFIKKFIKYLYICAKNNMILYIEDIYELCVFDKNLSMKNIENILNEFQSKYNLKIIWSMSKYTYDEVYRNKFSNIDCNTLYIYDLSSSRIRELVKEEIDKYLMKNKKYFEEQEYLDDIITILIELVNFKNRKNAEFSNNYILNLVIKNSFLLAKFDYSINVKIKHIIGSIYMCEELDNESKIVAIEKLNELGNLKRVRK